MEQIAQTKANRVTVAAMVVKLRAAEQAAFTAQAARLQAEEVGAADCARLKAEQAVAASAAVRQEATLVKEIEAAAILADAKLKEAEEPASAAHTARSETEQVAAAEADHLKAEHGIAVAAAELFAQRLNMRRAGELQRWRLRSQGKQLRNVLSSWHHWASHAVQPCGCRTGNTSDEASALGRFICDVAGILGGSESCVRAH